MLKSSVIKILQTFSNEDISDFTNFLNSPYHNKKSGVLKLFNEIRKYYPDLTDDGLNKEVLWKKLYPAKKFNYGVMKNLIFDLTKLSEQFIANQMYKKDELQELANLCKAFGERNLKNLLDIKYMFINKNYGEEKICELNDLRIDEFYHHHTKMLEAKMWNTQFHDQHVSIEKDITSYQSSFLTGMIINLIMGYYLTYTTSVNDKGSFNSKNTIGMLLKNIPDNLIDKVLEQVKDESETKYIILNCYYLGYKASINLNDSSHFNRFKKFVKKHLAILPFHSLIDMDVFLLNTIAMMSDKNFNRQQEAIDLFRFKIDNDIVLDRNGLINGATFLTLSSYLFGENNVENLENFINKYSKFVSDIEREASLQFADAYFLLLKSEFEKCLEKLSKIKFSSILLKDGLKKVTMLVYYEMDDYEMFLSGIDSFKHYINYSSWGGEELKDFRVNKAMEFCNCLIKLFKYKNEHDLYGIDMLEQEILGTSIDYKRWFLRKIEDVKKSKRRYTA